MNQKQAKKLDEIVDKVYDDWEGQGNEYGRWNLPIRVYVATRKSQCIYCDRDIVMGELKEAHGAHIKCYEAQYEISKHLVEIMKEKIKDYEYSTRNS